MTKLLLGIVDNNFNVKNSALSRSVRKLVDDGTETGQRFTCSSHRESNGGGRNVERNNGIINTTDKERHKNDRLQIQIEPFPPISPSPSPASSSSSQQSELNHQPSVKRLEMMKRLQQKWKQRLSDFLSPVFDLS